jgi:hypothetical protein
MNRISIILIYRSTPAASEMTATISRANLGSSARRLLFFADAIGGEGLLRGLASAMPPLRVGDFG